jgi:hypothetical protein
VHATKLSAMPTENKQMRLLLKIFVGVIALMLLLIFLTRIFVEPWIGGKLRTEFHDKNPEYNLEIEKVHILIFDSGIEIENILISSDSVQRILRHSSSKVTEKYALLSTRTLQDASDTISQQLLAASGEN